jgi:hypothetical protein
VSSENLMMVLESCLATQSWVNREYRRGLIVEDQCGKCFINYPYHLGAVRKTRIQLQRELFSPRVLSLVMSFVGTNVLNAEL